jgi:hypothetical protein
MDAPTEFAGPVQGKQQCTRVVARWFKSKGSPSNKPVVRNAVKKCGICMKETGHVRSGCPEYKALGTVVVDRDMFAASLISGQVPLAPRGEKLKLLHNWMMSLDKPSGSCFMPSFKGLGGHEHRKPC